jgi:demethoxyubiquinone hydroxylase (CLK1/Coq7/Cat5 family)
MLTLITHALSFILGAAAGWLGYRKYGAKAEAVRVEVSNTIKK